MTARRHRGGLLLALLLAAGCSRQPPTRFFTLESLADSGALVRRQPVAGSVGVGPLRVADYLRRSQLAGRVSATEVRFFEFLRWGEPLEDGVARALASNLQILLGAERVVLFPWNPRTPPDATVAIDLVRFEKQPGPEVELLARWTVRHQGDDGVLMRETRLREPIDVASPADGGGDEAMSDPASVVAALSRALETLSREIAPTLVVP